MDFLPIRIPKTKDMSMSMGMGMLFELIDRPLVPDPFQAPWISF
jgi:hypothetical protein